MNTVMLPNDIITVKDITLGEAHMLAICENSSKKQILYGMGSNKWG